MEEFVFVVVFEELVAVERMLIVFGDGLFGDADCLPQFELILCTDYLIDKETGGVPAINKQKPAQILHAPNLSHPIPNPNPSHRSPHNKNPNSPIPKPHKKHRLLPIITSSHSPSPNLKKVLVTNL